MRKASKWLCGIFGLTRTDVARDQHSSSKPPRHKRRWNLIRSFCRKNSSAVAVTTDIDCINNHVEPSMHINHNEHAITTADEAAVVTDRVTGSSSSSRLNMEIAAVTIQRVYRGHLARRALRALKAIVKVQAIVRGRIERKRAAEWLRRMQALMRRARIHARTGQFQITPSTQSTHSHQAIQGPLTPENCECGYRSKSRKYEQPPMVKSSGRILDNHETLYLGWNRSHLQIDEKIQDEEVHSTRLRSRRGSSKGSTFPVAKSTNESRRYLSGSSDHPNNYMAHTESSKAKVMSPWSWVAYDKHGEVAENTIVLDPPLAIEGEKEMLKWEQEAQAPGSIERNIKWKVNEDTTIKRRRKRGTHTSTKP